MATRLKSDPALSFSFNPHHWLIGVKLDKSRVTTRTRNLWTLKFCFLCFAVAYNKRVLNVAAPIKKNMSGKATDVIVFGAGK